MITILIFDVELPAGHREITRARTRFIHQAEKPRSPVLPFQNPSTCRPAIVKYLLGFGPGLVRSLALAWDQCIAMFPPTALHSSGSAAGKTLLARRRSLPDAVRINAGAPTVFQALLYFLLLFCFFFLPDNGPVPFLHLVFSAFVAVHNAFYRVLLGIVERAEYRSTDEQDKWSENGAEDAQGKRPQERSIEGV